MHPVLSQFINLFYPARCPICNEIEQRQLCLCDNCEKEIGRITDRCIGCGCPRNACVCHKYPLKLNLAAPFLFEGNVRKSIHRFKFGDETNLAVFYGKEIAACVKQEFGNVTFDIVTCVPQTKSKRNKRGYNQSALLAKQTAKHISVPFNELLLIKTRDTADQHNLIGKERIKNLKDAFATDKPHKVKGKTILLCDDIKTTGATLNECRNTLLKSGAKAVYCATIAVTPEKIRTE